jgi:intraflagellar transport protein 46
MSISQRDAMLLGLDAADALGIAPSSRYDHSIPFDDDSDSADDGSAAGHDPPTAPLGPHAFQSLTRTKNSGLFAAPDPPMADDFDAGAHFADRELAELYSIVTDFRPTLLEIAPHCKPFLPDLVPSIGTVDAFIKAPRPDGEEDPLGLTVLDEPTIGCSNPQILKMQLREKFGIVGSREADGYIGFLDSGVQRPKAIASFLEGYDEVARNRPAPTIAYSYKMPDLEELMQEWPPDMADALAALPLPTADMDLTLEEYSMIICAMLDITVKGNLVESLHVLFTLFQQFRDCGYFGASNAR